jgi:hypothetical protein
MSAPESPRDARVREDLRVLSFPFGDEPGRMNYIANANRADVLKVMQEFIDKNNNPDNFGKHA